MNKLSLRLSSLAEFTEYTDSIADIGADHGYLSAYLIKNELVKKVIASDIRESALNNAISTFKKENLKIKTYLSDGLNNLPLEDINTLVISGMGTKTILHILKEDQKLEKITKLIIQSNNDYDILRLKLSQKGYYLEAEKTIKDKNKWYITMKFIKSNKQNNKKILKYGYLENKEYNDYLLRKQKQILASIPITSLKQKIKTLLYYINLKNAMKHK